MRKPRPTSKRAARPAFLPVSIRCNAIVPTSGLTLELPGGGVLRFAAAHVDIPPSQSSKIRNRRFRE